ARERQPPAGVFSPKEANDEHRQARTWFVGGCRGGWQLATRPWGWLGGTRHLPHALGRQRLWPLLLPQMGGSAASHQAPHAAAPLLFGPAVRRSRRSVRGATRDPQADAPAHSDYPAGRFRHLKQPPAGVSSGSRAFERG